MPPLASAGMCASAPSVACGKVTMLQTLGGRSERESRSTAMTLGTILLIVLVLALLGAFPSWPHSKSWGYAPSGVLGVVVIVLLVLVLTGRL
jgi:fatty acid desaturase